MKHFIVEITYTVPFEQLADVLPEHRAYLQIGYDAGKLLLSGPQVPKVGGMVVARAASLEDIQEFFAADPYQKKGLATYRFVEFNPVKFQSFMEPWLS
jgi:uncharacterized protein YciI